VVKLEVLFLAGCLHPPHGPIAMSRLILQVPSGNRRPPKTRSAPARDWYRIPAVGHRLEG